jgi:hypothetical protein
MTHGRGGTADRSYTLTPAGIDRIATLDEVRATRVQPRTNIVIPIPADHLPFTVHATAVQITDRGEHGGVQMTCTVQMHEEEKPITAVVHLTDETRTLIASVLGGIGPASTSTERGADS